MNEYDILNMPHVMLLFKNIKLIFWDDVVQFIFYLRNIYPSQALDNKTPFEIWFGCVTFV